MLCAVGHQPGGSRSQRQSRGGTDEFDGITPVVHSDTSVMARRQRRDAQHQPAVRSADPRAPVHDAIAEDTTTASAAPT